MLDVQPPPNAERSSARQRVAPAVDGAVPSASPATNHAKTIAAESAVGGSLSEPRPSLKRAGTGGVDAGGPCCPGCQKRVDALRAAEVAILGGKFLYFCSRDCKRSVLSMVLERLPDAVDTLVPPAVEALSGAPSAVSAVTEEALQADPPATQLPPVALVTKVVEVTPTEAHPVVARNAVFPPAASAPIAVPAMGMAGVFPAAPEGPKAMVPSAVVSPLPSPVAPDGPKAAAVSPIPSPVAQAVPATPVVPEVPKATEVSAPAPDAAVRAGASGTLASLASRGPSVAADHGGSLRSASVRPSARTSRPSQEPAGAFFAALVLGLAVAISLEAFAWRTHPMLCWLVLATGAIGLLAGALRTFLLRRSRGTFAAPALTLLALAMAVFHWFVSPEARTSFGDTFLLLALMMALAHLELALGWLDVGLVGGSPSLVVAFADHGRWIRGARWGGVLVAALSAWAVRAMGAPWIDAGLSAGGVWLALSPVFVEALVGSV